MRSSVIVLIHPYSSMFPYFSYAEAQVCIQDLLAIASIKSFDVPIQGGLTRLGILYVDPLVFTPKFKMMTGILRSIINTYGKRLATAVYYLL
nr:hypothetical protein [Arcticibacter tournemirensis]